MTNVEDGAEMEPQPRVRFGYRNTGKLCNSRRCCAGIEKILKIVHHFVRRFKEAIEFRLDRQPNGAAASLFVFDQVPHNAPHTLRVLRNDLEPGAARLASERR